MPHDAPPEETTQSLRDALAAAQGQANGGFGLEMWATVVNRDGVVCAVVFSGQSRGDQWPGSRVISAQKANTANAFSLPGLTLSTANLYTAVQPGGSLFGLQESNPVNVDVRMAATPRTMAAPTIRWSADASASMCSAEVSRCMLDPRQRPVRHQRSGGSYKTRPALRCLVAV